jgi:hypothetical protein
MIVCENKGVHMILKKGLEIKCFEVHLFLSAKAGPTCCP